MVTDDLVMATGDIQEAALYVGVRFEFTEGPFENDEWERDTQVSISGPLAEIIDLFHNYPAELEKLV